MAAPVFKRCQTKVATEPGARWVLARINTIAVDRGGDVLVPSGVVLDDFKLNPVVNLGHPSLPGGHPLPVGTAKITTRPNEIVAKVTFADRPPEHPAALEWVPDTVHELFKQNVLRGFSVGYLILPGGARLATHKDRARFGDQVHQVVTKWKLAELSIVQVPENQEALAIAVSKRWMPRDSWLHGELGESVETMLDILGEPDQDVIVVPPAPMLVIG